MNDNKNFRYQLILASRSPRRQLLLKEIGFNYTIRIKDTQETYPPELKREEIALYLCKLKASAFENELENNTIILAGDTIVCLNDLIIGKPKDYEDAINILKLISGKKHDVITGICLRSAKKERSFYVLTSVYFRTLSLAEISYYLEKYQPYDKAGAYGIQEWIGLIGIDKIEGSYFNVMGLPTKELYEELMAF